MSNKDLKLEPQHIEGKGGVWWYELPRGVEIHVENTAIDPKTGQAIFVIRWGIIERALKRKARR